MADLIALLRGINVGGAKRVVMADLRALLGDLGFGAALTLLQSGNVVFDAGGADPDAVERQLEATLEERLGLKIAVFVRTASAWDGVIAANPFPAEAENDPGRLLVLALKRAPAPESVKALHAAIPGRETVKACDRHAYAMFPDGIGPSRLTPAVLERHLGPCTGRNWNTVLKLAAATRSRAN